MIWGLGDRGEISISLQAREAPVLQRWERQEEFDPSMICMTLITHSTAQSVSLPSHSHGFLHSCRTCGYFTLQEKLCFFVAVCIWSAVELILQAETGIPVVSMLNISQVLCVFLYVLQSGFCGNSVRFWPVVKLSFESV